MSISVIINTYNSARHLEKVIDSVKDFDEIIVCDMESTDETVDIARHKGARVITFPKRNHTCCEPARNFAIEHASCDWVFVVDADELVPHALRRYLYRYISGKRPADGLYIPRRNYILDRFRSAKYPDYQMRFFRSNVADWPPYVHSEPTIDGTVSKIPSNKRELALIHIPHSIDVQIRRLDAYTTAEVEKDPDRKISLAGLTLKPLGQFISSYLIKGGFRYGIPGFIAASHDAVYQFYREAKIYESHVKSKIPTEIPEETVAILGEDEEIEATRKERH